jgi:hypothetical protein
MVYKTQNHRVYELCPSSRILNNYTTQSFLNLDLFLSSGVERETPTLLDPLEMDNLNHWTLYLYFICVALHPRPHLWTCVATYGSAVGITLKHSISNTYCITHLADVLCIGHRKLTEQLQIYSFNFIDIRNARIPYVLFFSTAVHIKEVQFYSVLLTRASST